MNRRAVIVLVASLATLATQRLAWAAEPPAEKAGKTKPVDKRLRLDVNALREAAERGEAQAQYDLAGALDCGRGVKRDRAEALHWFQKAAEQGHVGAQSALGWKYMAGEGVQRDDAAAFDWLKRAAEHGNTSAQNNLGILYAHGRGVAADAREAEKWFRAAAEKGATDAQRNLDALRAGRRRDVRPSAQLPLPLS